MSYNEEEKSLQLTARGKQIDKQKYNSVIADRQRTLRRTRIETLGIKYEVFMKNLGAAKLINNIYKVNLDFTKSKIDLQNDFVEQKSGRANYQITNFIKLKNALRITIFNEGKDALFWTTYIFQASPIRKLLRFTYRETQKHDTIQDRLSPGGSTTMFLFRREMKKRFEIFIASKLQEIIDQCKKN